MAVTKRQGRSKEGPRTRVKTSGRTEQTALLTKPNLHRAGPGGGKNISTEQPKHFLRDSLSHVHARSLSLSLSHVCTLSLSLSPHALLHSLLFESWIVLLSSK